MSFAGPSGFQFFATWEVIFARWFLFTDSDTCQVATGRKNECGRIEKQLTVN
jgi:hypothetical protein